MRLWTLQAAVIAFFLLVGWAVTVIPTVRTTSRLQQMCATVKPGDPVGLQLCADLKRS